MRSDADRVPASSWWTLAVFTVAGWLSYMDRYILNLLVQPVGRDLQLSDRELSLAIGAAFAVVYAIAGLPLGRLADRWRRREVAAIGVAVWGVGTIACALAENFRGLALGRLIVGFGEAALAPAAFGILAALFPPSRRGLAFSIFMVGLAMGNGSSLLLGGWLFQAAEGGAFANWPLLGDLAAWRVVLVLSGAPALLVVAALLTVREPPKTANVAAGSAVTAMRRIVQDPRRLWLIYLGLAFVGVAEFAFTAWKPTLFVRRFGYTPGEAGELLGAITLALAISVTLAGGIASDRLYRTYGIGGRLMLFTGGLVLAALTVPFIAMAGQGAALVGVVLATTGLGLAASTGIVVVQDLLPSDLRGFGTGLLSFLIILLGFSIGPTAVAWITEGVLRDPSAIGWSIAIVVAAASFAGAGAAALMRRKLNADDA